MHVLSFVSVKSHFESVENNILSDIRNFHTNLLFGTEASANTSTDTGATCCHAETPETPGTGPQTGPGTRPMTTGQPDNNSHNSQQYIISSFKPDGKSWSIDQPRQFESQLSQIKQKV